MEIKGKIIISPGLAARLLVPPGCQSLRVRVGAIVVNTELVIGNGQRSSYILSPDLRKALYISKRKSLPVRYQPDENIIHFGPTIGILSSGLPNRPQYDPKSLQAELIMLSQMGRKIAGQVYVFTPGSIDWNRSTVRGCNYVSSKNGKGYWTSGIYPLPDVVYDRIGSRIGEGREKTKYMKARLKRLPYLRYFNPAFLNKWKVHQILNSHPGLKPYLPHTMILNEVNLEILLSTYPEVYLKPANGSLGSGIIKVKTLPSGMLQYIRYGGGRRRGQAENPADLLKKTREFRQDRSYIVQQGLNLATYKGCNFDLRIIYQKNSRGEWQIGKKFARVARPGSAVANMARGGEAVPSRRVFNYIFSKEQIEAKNREIKELCFKVASTMERNGDLWGELGLDLGIDKQGHPWLIEVNSKPRKTTETEYSQSIMKNTFRRPLEYATFLAGFGTKSQN